MKTYVFFDIETSVDARIATRMEKPPIVWIVGQAVNAETGELVGQKFDQKILFREDRADQDILELIRYKAEDWADAKPPAVVADMFSTWLRQYAWVERTSKKGSVFYNAVLAGQNVKQFDIPVIIQWYKGLCQHFNRSFWLPAWYYPYVDTLNMVQVYEGVTGLFSESNALPVVCDRLGIEFSSEEHHHPYHDTMASIEIWRRISSLFVTLIKDDDLVEK